MEFIIALEALLIMFLLYKIYHDKNVYEKAKNETAVLMEKAKAEASKITEDAKAEASKILEGVKAEANDIRLKEIEKAKAEADRIISDGQKEASEIIADASEANRRLLDENVALELYLKRHDQDVLKSELLKKQIDEQNDSIADNNRLINNQNDKIKILKSEIKRAKEILQRNFYEYPSERVCFNNLENALEKLESLLPTVEIPLKALEYEDLKKQVKENRKQIKELFKKYESRYTTKQNKSIYQLMVIALQAELQNIVFNLRFSNYEKSFDLVNVIVNKYLIIASDGNQTIHPTMVKFIGEIEYLFKRAVILEYEYYVRQENIKEEQRALREQMRQEAQELKALQEEKDKLLREENKFKFEIEENRKKLETEEDTGQIKLLKNRINELELQLSTLNTQKEQIINLQNGKAGYVYIISNLGSFGDKVFKIGMTRRLDPQDRINELGSASVPFKFDVHSFIFSEDAVSLEAKLHQVLDAKRVNKINLRKEFFYSSIDELEALVRKIQPTASFIRTMLAEQYHQTLSLEKQRLEIVEG